MTTKFQVGDKVRFNRKIHRRHQIPQYMRDELSRVRTRTVIGIIHDERNKRVFYELSGRGKARIGYVFRSHELVKVTPEQATQRGRPKTKRRRRAQKL